MLHEQQETAKEFNQISHKFRTCATKPMLQDVENAVQERVH